MPIVISRATGEVVSAPEYSQAQKDKAWEAIVRNYVQKHPEIFDEEEPQ